MIGEKMKKIILLTICSILLLFTTFSTVKALSSKNIVQVQSKFLFSRPCKLSSVYGFQEGKISVYDILHLHLDRTQCTRSTCCKNKI